MLMRAGRSAHRTAEEMQVIPYKDQMLLCTLVTQTPAENSRVSLCPRTLRPRRPLLARHTRPLRGIGETSYDHQAFRLPSGSKVLTRDAQKRYINEAMDEGQPGGA